MKIRMFVLVFFMACAGCIAAEVALLIPLKVEVTQAVDKVYEDLGKRINEESLYFMKITGNSEYAIDVALVPMANVADVLYGKDFTVNGYFSHKGLTVIVFGTMAEPFFKKAGETLDFPVLEKITRSEPYILPDMDFYVWKFLYKNSTLTVLEVRFFDFFDGK